MTNYVGESATQYTARRENVSTQTSKETRGNAEHYGSRTVNWNTVQHKLTTFANSLEAARILHS